MFLAYPYTDLYNLNLDWMIKAIKEVQEVIENLGSVVNTFNEREGDVVLTASDVNNLQIDSVVTLPEGSFDTITEAQKTAYYEAGKRIIVALNTYGDYSKLGFLYKAGASVGMAEYVPTQEEYAVLSFNGRTGRVTLNDSDVNNLQIQPVLQLNGRDVSSLTTNQKLQYFDAGIRFIHCVPVQGGTITTQKLYTLNVNESGGTRIPYVTAYDPLQGQGLVKAVNSESPNTSGQLFLYADDITMANDDNDTVYDRIRDLESAAVTSVNGVTPTQGAVEITGSSIQVASDDDTTIDDFAVDVYSELEARVKSVNGVTPNAAGAVTITGADVAVSAGDSTTVNAKFDNYQLIVKDSITYITGDIQVDIQSTGNVDYITVLNAVYVQLFNTMTTSFAVVDATLFVANQSYRWYLKGFVSKPNNSGFFELTIPLIRNTPIIAVVRFDAVTLLDGFPTMKDLAYFEQYATATRAYSKGDYVYAHDGLYRTIKDTPIGTSLQNTSFAEKMNTAGVLNEYTYDDYKLPAECFDGVYLSNTDYALRFSKLGKLKILRGTIRVLQNSPSAVVTIATWPEALRPTGLSLHITATSWIDPINKINFFLKVDGVFSMKQTSVTIPANGEYYIIDAVYM